MKTYIMILLLVLLLVGCYKADTRLQREGCKLKGMSYSEWEKDITWCIKSEGISSKSIGFNTRELYKEVLCGDIEEEKEEIITECDIIKVYDKNISICIIKAN